MGRPAGRSSRLPHRATLSTRSPVRAPPRGARSPVPEADSRPAIRVRDLRETFRVPVREAGLGAAVRSLVRRQHRDIDAVRGVSLSIEPRAFCTTCRSRT